MRKRRNNTPAVPWTNVELRLLSDMRAVGLTWPQIAAALPGRSPAQCAGRWHHEQMRAVAADRKAAGLRQSGGLDVPQGVLTDRARRQEAPHRDLAGAVFGDPPKGFSALDRRRGAS